MKGGMGGNNGRKEEDGGGDKKGSQRGWEGVGGYL